MKSGATTMKLLLCVAVLFLVLPEGAYANNNGMGLLPPMGWSTWCTESYEYFLPCMTDYCSESEILSVATSMIANNLTGLGYNHIILDDCWAGQRDAQGNIVAEKSRFPNGLKPLITQLHRLGFKFGLYTDVGFKTCKGGRPGSWPYYAQDAKTYAEWGVDYVKMDWCSHPAQYTAQQLYTNMSQALNSSQRHIFFALCEWGLYEPWTWAPNISNSWRIGPDHFPVWWTPPLGQTPGQGQGTSNIIENLAGKSKYARSGAWNDPDFLMTGITVGGMTDNDYITEFSFWALANAPLIVASDVRDLSNKQALLNKEVIDVNQDPLGIAGDRRMNSSDGGQIWSKAMSGGRWSAIMYNANWVEFVSLSVVWEEHLVGWPKGVKQAKVRDLWQHKDLGVFTHEYHQTIYEGHAVVMLLISPVQ